MIGSLGVPELLFILVLALLVFGPRKLPEIGRTLGKALGEFRRATSDLKRTLDVELTAEDLNPTKPTKTPSQTAARQIEEPAKEPPVGDVDPETADRTQPETPSGSADSAT